MAQYKGAASEAGRAMQLMKKREREREQLEQLKQKIAEDNMVKSNIDKKFSAHYDAVEQELKSSTVGLVTLNDMKAKQEALVKEREKQLAKKEQSKELQLKLEKQKEKKRKEEQKRKIASLSFNPDEGEDEDEEENDDEEDDGEEIEITFSYWDGSGHRKTVKMKKGNTIQQFLQRALEVLRKDFSELRSAGVEQLMYIKEDLIIPHHHSFYDFIVTKARGKSGPLFSFDVHDDIRLVNDATVEKDESHAGKVVLRSWYEKNKHIFPASRWEPYDPEKKWDKYTGIPGCEYCRISKEDVAATLNYTLAGLFGGQQTPEICQHYVHAPQNVTIDFGDDKSSRSDTVVVSWRPSQYGVAFLQGFQVALQALGGSQIFCQLFLLQNNPSISTVHAERVYYSDSFSQLSLGTQYAVTVMAIPVPEQWDKFYNSKLFFTRTCAEKNGLEHCRSDWHPSHVEVRQDSQDIVVTFNLAPENLGISRYFSACVGGGSRSYEIIHPNFSLNKTHHTYRLLNLHSSTNYTCEIAADIVDAVRKKFLVYVQHNSKDIIKAYFDKHLDEQQSVALTNNTRPPQLLICYSSNDGPAHVKVVLQLATFLQKHMATQVHLDLWDALNIMEEGDLRWYCKKMKESDFVMVICSRGLNQKQQSQETEEDDIPVVNTSLAIIGIIGEEICQAKALGLDLSKYMTAIFEYSKESDVPSILNLASNYMLPKDLPLLFSHLHGVALQKPGAYLRVENISENEYSKLLAGMALRHAIQEVKILNTG
ncbi:hypothetical protein NFI96_002811 [Prochilodus magdalenae]|nr:hypothetical protein NFI96_002811 [Prochilodus magdalenae]